MRKIIVFCIALLITGYFSTAFGDAFEGFEIDTGDWVFYDGGAQSQQTDRTAQQVVLPGGARQ